MLFGLDRRTSVHELSRIIVAARLDCLRVVAGSGIPAGHADGTLRL